MIDGKQYYVLPYIREKLTAMVIRENCVAKIRPFTGKEFLEPVQNLRVRWMGRNFFVRQGKKRRNTGCIPSMFDAAGRKKAGSDGVPGDFEQALRGNYKGIPAVKIEDWLQQQ